MRPGRRVRRSLSWRKSSRREAVPRRPETRRRRHCASARSAKAVVNANPAATASAARAQPRQTRALLQPSSNAEPRRPTTIHPRNAFAAQQAARVYSLVLKGIVAKMRRGFNAAGSICTTISRAVPQGSQARVTDSLRHPQARNRAAVRTVFPRFLALAIVFWPFGVLFSPFCQRGLPRPASALPDKCGARPRARGRQAPLLCRPARPARRPEE